MRTFELDDAVLDENEPLQKFLTDTAYAIRMSYLTTQKATPAQLVFGRDMVLPVDFETDWNEITRRKQEKIDKNNARENKRRINHTYQRGDKVLLKAPKQMFRKLEVTRRGTHTVVKHHRNGSVTIRKGPCVTDTVNVRRLNPFYEE